MDITISKWGNSTGIRIPAAIVKTYNLQSGDTLTCNIEGNKMIFSLPENKKNNKISMEALFKDYHGDYQPAETDWGKPEGNEIW